MIDVICWAFAVWCVCGLFAAVLVAWMRRNDPPDDDKPPLLVVLFAACLLGPFLLTLVLSCWGFFKEDDR